MLLIVDYYNLFVVLSFFDNDIKNKIFTIIIDIIMLFKYVYIYI